MPEEKKSACVVASIFTAFFAVFSVEFSRFARRFTGTTSFFFTSAGALDLIREAATSDKTVEANSKWLTVSFRQAR